jgi:hypothetical protein
MPAALASDEMTAQLASVLGAFFGGRQCNERGRQLRRPYRENRSVWRRKL